MSRTSAEIEWLLISEAVARLEAGMYGGFHRPEPVEEIKKYEPWFSVGWGPQKEHAAKLVDEAIMKGDLSVYVLSHSAEDNAHRAPLQVPLGILGRMIRTHGGLPDHAIAPMRRFAKDSVTPELLAALAKSALYLRRDEFDAWYKNTRKKRNWPSQRSSEKSRIGRPPKQTEELRNPIIGLVNYKQWSAEQNSIADLVRLLKSKGAKGSRQTVERTVEQLHWETGDPRYYYADPRKKSDDSVWCSFEDLMQRRRREHLRKDQKS
jgi:hypothetical protein